MRITSFGKTDIGRTRQENEDAFLVDEASQIFVVADGLGGLPGGREASELAVEVFREQMDKHRDHEEIDVLVEAVQAANRAVFEDGHERFGADGNGTTFTAARRVGDALQIAHVGDSAAYLFRDGELTQLTKEHTMAAALAERLGPDSHREIPAHLHHTLTRCLGPYEEVQVDQDVITLQQGDILLLATDGLTKPVVDGSLSEILGEHIDPRDAAADLIKEALASGSTDNITVVVGFVR